MLLQVRDWITSQNSLFRCLRCRHWSWMKLRWFSESRTINVRILSLFSSPKTTEGALDTWLIGVIYNLLRRAYKRWLSQIGMEIIQTRVHFYLKNKSQYLFNLTTDAESVELFISNTWWSRGTAQWLPMFTSICAKNNTANESFLEQFHTDHQYLTMLLTLPLVELLWVINSEQW